MCLEPVVQESYSVSVRHGPRGSSGGVCERKRVGRVGVRVVSRSPLSLRLCLGGPVADGTDTRIRGGWRVALAGALDADRTGHGVGHAGGGVRRSMPPRDFARRTHRARRRGRALYARGVGHTDSGLATRGTGGKSARLPALAARHMGQAGGRGLGWQWVRRPTGVYARGRGP